jgi:hypothetical protein
MPLRLGYRCRAPPRRRTPAHGAGAHLGGDVIACGNGVGLLGSRGLLEPRVHRRPQSQDAYAAPRKSVAWLFARADSIGRPSTTRRARRPGGSQRARQDSNCDLRAPENDRTCLQALAGVRKRLFCSKTSREPFTMLRRGSMARKCTSAAGFCPRRWRSCSRFGRSRSSCR